MRKIFSRFWSIIALLMLLSCGSCSGDDPDISEDKPTEGKDAINQNIKHNEEHCDIVFGMAFTPELLEFVKPNISIKIDGYEPCPIPLTDGIIVSAAKHIKFNKFLISVYPEKLNVWWVGIQRKGVYSKGELLISFEKKDVDYSSYPQDLILSCDSFIAAEHIQASLYLENYSFINLTIGPHKTLEEQIDELVNKNYNLSFDTTKKN